MKDISKIIMAISMSLIIIGSFLPWSRFGDLMPYLVYGIKFYPAFSDNGGFLFLCLCIILIVLIFRPFRFIVKPQVWNLFLCAILLIVSTFHILKLWISFLSARGIIGAPEIQIGLVMVFIGSLTLFFIQLLSIPKNMIDVNCKHY